ncbi:MAG: outer membrane protein assembly factor BamB [Oleibacter sp.]|nr:outer membrane protein assembly factor BamB [Thalassolituus sp.]
MQYLRTWLGVSLALLIAVQISGCASQPDQVLPPIEGDASADVKWRTQLGEGPGTQYTRLKAAVQDDVVYAADTRGEVVALELASGSRLWSIDIDQDILGGVTVANDQLFISLNDGTLAALSTDDGEEIWRAVLPSEAVARVAYDSDRVYAQTVDGRVTALERSNGAQVWSYEAGMPVLSVRGTGAPLVLEQVIVVGFATGKLVALDKTLGVPRWDTRLGVPDGRSELERLVDVDGEPVIEGRTIYAASYHGKVTAVTEMGDVIWQETASSYTSPELALGSLYLVLDNDVIRSFDMVTGAEVWTQEALKGRGLGQVTSTGAMLAVADAEGYVHLLSQIDGHLMGRKLLRARPLHVNYPHQPEATNWRLLRGRDFGIRSSLVNTDEGLLVYTNAGELILLKTGS